MGRRVAIVMAVVTMAAGLVTAQNARMDALGNLYILDDMSTLLTNPADMNDYGNTVQGTYSDVGGAGAALFMGVKSLGDMFNAGITYDSDGILYDPVPHFLFGADFGPLGFGVDLFYERTITKSYTEDQTPQLPGPPVIPASATINETSDKDQLWGMQLGLNIDPDVIDMAISAALMLPVSEDYTYNESTALGKSEVTTKSTGRMLIQGGVEL
ncbi:MAG: hypothetical protein GF331_14065, partial [Chitinivibrionales bacterium]|nr:hypothetical protein [Chitinivibrionales bacterium]